MESSKRQFCWASVAYCGLIMAMEKAPEKAEAWVLPLEIHRTQQDPPHVFEVMTHEISGKPTDTIYVIENCTPIHSDLPFSTPLQKRCIRRISTNKCSGGDAQPLAEVPDLSNSVKEIIVKKLGCGDQALLNVSSCKSGDYYDLFIKRLLTHSSHTDIITHSARYIDVRGAVDLIEPGEEARISAAQQRSNIIVAENITPQMLLDSIAHAALLLTTISSYAYWEKQAAALRQNPHMVAIFNTKKKQEGGA